MTTIVVDRCRVRVVNRCPWLTVDHVTIGRVASRVVVEHVLDGLLDRAARTGADLDDAVVHVRFRAEAGELVALAAQQPLLPIAVAHRLVPVLDVVAAELPRRVELVSTAADAHGGPADDAPGLRLGALAATCSARTVRRTAARPSGSEPALPARGAGDHRAEGDPVVTTWSAAASSVAPDDDVRRAPVVEVVADEPRPVPTVEDAGETGGAAVPPAARREVHPGTARPAASAGLADRWAPTEPTNVDDGARPAPLGATAPTSRAMSAKTDPVHGVLGRATVRSVLPYLVLVSLHQHGLLDELDDTLAGCGLGDRLADVIAAIGRKVLAPPPRGSADRSELVVAGLLDEPDGWSLERLERGATTWLEPVTVSAATTLFVDRPAGAALVLWADEDSGSMLLADDDGLFPIAWTVDPATVRRWWEVAGRPAMLTNPEARWAGADVATADTDDGDRVGRLGRVRALLDARPAAPWTRLPALEMGLGVLAGFALADIAHRVFRALGPTDPGQALVHFADLDGRVDLRPDRVVVEMAVGRRHADLRDAGLLETIPAAAWLGGRDVELLGA